MSWLRVFTSANTAHLGHRVGQERSPRVVPSEKDAARGGSVEDGMRMITACFACVPQRCTSHTYMHFFLTFQEVRPISKTRNRLKVKWPPVAMPSITWRLRYAGPASEAVT